MSGDTQENPRRMEARRLLGEMAQGGPFAEHVDVLSGLLRPACALIPVTGTVGVADSHAGGLPGLPDGMGWPMLTRADGFVEPFTFIGQVRLDELDPEWWDGPHTGLLSFFYAQGNHRHTEDDEVARVLHVPQDGLHLGERPHDNRPEDLCHPCHPLTPFPARRWEMAWRYELPGALSAALRPLGLLDQRDDDGQDDQVDDDELDADDEFDADDDLDADDAFALVEKFFDFAFDFVERQGVQVKAEQGEEVFHISGATLLGWPPVDQFDVLEQNADDGPWQDWTTLLCTGADATNLMFTLPAADLARSDFGGVQATSY